MRSQIAKTLANHLPTLNDLMTATPEYLGQINGIGQKLSTVIVLFFEDQTNRKIIERLQDLGVCNGQNSKKWISEIFKNKNFVITGTLNSMTRQEASIAIEERGGNVTESVSKKTDILIEGINPGSKLERARDIGIEIWTEATLLERLKNMA